MVESRISHKLVVCCGPRGAGKDTLALALMNEWPAFYRLLAVTTRSPRPSEREGREYRFVEDMVFEQYSRAGAFICEFTIGKSQRSGVLTSEMASAPLSITVTIPRCARTMRGYMRRIGGSALLIYLHASDSLRRQRIRSRDSSLTDAQIIALMAEDPVRNSPAMYRDFDICAENNVSPDELLFAVRRPVAEYIRSL